MENIINITDSARLYLSSLFKKEGKSSLRITLTGGGCSGYIVKFEFDHPSEKDKEVLTEDGSILIDPKTALFISGSTLNFKTELNDYGLRLENVPNSKRTCGCGESFSF